MEQGFLNTTQSLFKSHDITTAPCRKAGGERRVMGKKKKHFVPPEEIDREVELILDTIYCDGRWNLVSYREKSLNEALRILRKYGKRMALQEAIQAEIHERLLCRTQPGRKPREV